MEEEKIMYMTKTELKKYIESEMKDNEIVLIEKAATCESEENIWKS